MGPIAPPLFPLNRFALLPRTTCFCPATDHGADPVSWFLCMIETRRRSCRTSSGRKPEDYRRTVQRVYHAPGQASFIELPCPSRHAELAVGGGRPGPPDCGAGFSGSFGEPGWPASSTRAVSDGRQAWRIA